MADYRDYEREPDPQHCGDGRIHEMHTWHEMFVGMHLCTGQVASNQRA